MTRLVKGAPPGYSAFIVNPKHAANRGSVERAVWNFGGYWIIRRGMGRGSDATDTCKASRHLPPIDLPDDPQEAHCVLLNELGEDLLIIAVDTPDVLARGGLRTGWWTLRNMPVGWNTVYMFGNETLGLPDDWLAIADEGLSIPMGRVPGSLNVAIAAGIVLHAAMDRYGRGLPGRTI